MKQIEEKQWKNAIVCSFTYFPVAKVHIVGLSSSRTNFKKKKKFISFFAKYHYFPSFCWPSKLPHLIFLSFSIFFCLFFPLPFLWARHSSCKLKIHSTRFPYEHISWLASRKRSFLWKIVLFLSLFVLRDPSTSSLSIRYFWRPFSFQYRCLFSPKCFCSSHCQHRNSRHHTRGNNPEKSPTSWTFPHLKKKIITFIQEDVLVV